MKIFNDTKIEKMKTLAPIVVRIGLSLVLLWFGTQQIIHTSMWVRLIPNWAVSISGMSTVTLVHVNGIFEIVFGALLFLGYFTELTAFLLALHLFGIMFTVGYGSIGVRDFGLAMAMTSVFLHGTDGWCLDRFLNRQKEADILKK